MEDCLNNSERKELQQTSGSNKIRTHDRWLDNSIGRALQLGTGHFVNS